MIKVQRHKWRRLGQCTFAGDRAGSVALIFAMVLPVVVLLTAGSVDFVMAIKQKSRLQQLVDAAALAAAKELSLSNTKTEQVAATIETMVKAHFEAMKDPLVTAKPNITTKITKSPLQVDVSATQAFEPPFGGAFGFNVGELEARAVAQVIGRPNICVLALHETSNGTLSLEQNARVTGDDCAVYSNSTHNIGIKSKNSAVLTATTICSAGGVQGDGKNFQPAPYFDCPQFEDPLAGRAEPFAGACDPTRPTKITSSRFLSPGTYCGLEISNGAQVTLSSGKYIIKNKPLIVSGGAKLSGKHVGFFFAGSAYFELKEDTTISLEAPITGPMAGLLLFATRASTGKTHKILSKDAQVMVGTIYVPKDELRIDGAADVGSESAYTAIVANKLRLYGGPHIKLNTDYDETDVPVPDGIKGAGQPIMLKE